MKESILLGVSNRHVHLSRKDVAKLFGRGSTLTIERALGQPGQFKAKERIDLVGPQEEIKNVAIVGPARSKTQIELLPSDQATLGIQAPFRISGDIKGTPKITIRGTKGMIETDGVIIALNHLHLHTEHVERLGLLGRKHVDLLVEKDQRLFGNVPLRHGNDHDAEFHVDRDYAMKFHLEHGDKISLVIDGKTIEQLV